MTTLLNCLNLQVIAECDDGFEVAKADSMVFVILMTLPWILKDFYFLFFVVNYLKD